MTCHPRIYCYYCRHYIGHHARTIYLGRIRGEDTHMCTDCHSRRQLSMLRAR